MGEVKVTPSTRRRTLGVQIWQSWEVMAGTEGICIVRRGRVVEAIITKMNWLHLTWLFQSVFYWSVPAYASTATRQRAARDAGVNQGKHIMKISTMRSAIILSSLLLLISHHALADASLTEEQALDILVSRIKKDKLYDSWTTLSCLSFMTEDRTKHYFNFSIHEKHGGKCPGDPNTYPTVDRFRVNRFTKKIQWNEPTEDEWLPYTSVVKARLRKWRIDIPHWMYKKDKLTSGSSPTRKRRASHPRR